MFFIYSIAITIVAILACSFDFNTNTPCLLLSPLPTTIQSRTGQQNHSIIRLPFHVRYHQPSLHLDNTSISLENPQSFVFCQDWIINDLDGRQDSLSTQLDQLYGWKRLTMKSLQNNTLTLEIPIGLLQHYFFVTTSTLLTTLMASFLVLACLFQKS